MALRKAASYSKKKVVPYTRVSKKKEKSYIKTVPQSNVVKFVMGSIEMYNKGELPYEVVMISEEKAQVRSNALEACRQYIHKILDKNLAGKYLFKVIPFPHHIQRENKMLTGAGADRMQSGMQLSFGKPTARATILNPETKIFWAALPNEKTLKLTREVFERVKSKIPCKVRIVSEIKKQAAN
ncbi:MAG: 50S ribosomal protein L16 [Candidatus Pacearchaeota archaeon]|nr:MAG: 50S ribosomal protein L16 [Candidatus Pacearchaeota archaeon]